MLPLRKHKVKLGSPPRGRGKGKDYATAETMQGITPAWAGKSMQAALRSSSAGDHPRMGGEKCKPAQRTAPHQGSPPHGRGKGSHAAPVVGTGGITPAWAGKSHPRTAPRHRAQDHPRMGGEKLLVRRSVGWRWGSPPHGRGKDPLHHMVDGAAIITPAWAGKRCRSRW